MLAGLSEVHPQLRRESSGLTRSQLSDSRQPVLPRQSSQDPSGIHPTKSEQGAPNAGLPRAAQGANQPQHGMPQHDSDQAHAQLLQPGTPQARPLSDALQHAGGHVDQTQSIVPQLMQPDSQPLTGDHSLLTGPVSQSAQPMPQSLGGLEGLNSDPAPAAVRLGGQRPFSARSVTTAARAAIKRTAPARGDAASPVGTPLSITERGTCAA